MTVLTRWEPFRELNTLQSRLNRLFEEQTRGGSEESLTAGAFVPPVDVYEDEHSIQLKLEVPGIDEKDLDIKVENNVLTVSGERKFEKEEKEENFRRVERRYGSFTRSFTLPTTVDSERRHRRLQRWRVEAHAGQAGRSQAQADQGEHRQQGPGSQEGPGGVSDPPEIRLCWTRKNAREAERNIASLLCDSERSAGETLGLLGQGVVVVADGAGDFPGAVFVLP